MREKTGLSIAIEAAVKAVNPHPGEERKKIKPDPLLDDAELRALTAAVGLGIAELNKKVIAGLNNPQGGGVHWSPVDFALVRLMFRHFYKAAGVSDDVYNAVWASIGDDGGPGNGGSPGSNPNPPPSP
jgi:hypothetical protein